MMYCQQEVYLYRMVYCQQEVDLHLVVNESIGGRFILNGILSKAGKLIHNGALSAWGKYYICPYLIANDENVVAAAGECSDDVTEKDVKVPQVPDLSLEVIRQVIQVYGAPEHLTL